MPVFDNREFDAHEQVAFCHDPESGLAAIIAIHNTSRGGALGGCRMWPYEDEAAAVTDVLRLSRSMTYKSALADLPFGGGKSVIIGDPRRDKSDALFRAMGRFVDSLGGRYTVAEDIGISVADVEAMGKQTGHVAGISGGSGDPSPATAYGVYQGIHAAVKHRLGRDALDGVSVAVQGAGHVGYHLCRYLKDAGADVLVSDITAERAERAVRDLDVRAVAPEEVLAQPVDVIAPCALGGVIDDAAIERLQAQVVAGAANNQLAEARHGRALRERGILYAPDYVINAGGIINISYEGADYDRARAFAHVARIYETLLAIFARADQQGIATNEAADRLAEERFSRPGSPSAAA